MHVSAKPVRKCHGCGLNLGDHCGVFENPRLMWERHAICPGYKNEKMLAEYQAAEARRQADLKKEKRRLRAKMQHAVPHQNGDQHVKMLAEYHVAEARRQADLKKGKRRQPAKMQRAVPRQNGSQHVIISAVRR